MNANHALSQETGLRTPYFFQKPIHTFDLSSVLVYTDYIKQTEVMRSLYDNAPIEAKKMIVNSMIKRVDVYRNYDLNIELNMNIRQFFLGMEETENIPITA